MFEKNYKSKTVVAIAWISFFIIFVVIPLIIFLLFTWSQSAPSNDIIYDIKKNVVVSKSGIRYLSIVYLDSIGDYTFKLTDDDKETDSIKILERNDGYKTTTGGVTEVKYCFKFTPNTKYKIENHSSRALLGIIYLCINEKGIVSKWDKQPF